MTHNTTTGSDDSTRHEERHLGHVMSAPVLIGVWAALMILTVVTVQATYFDLGPWNIWLAMAIATLKAVLVAMYFMHLRYDSPFHGIILIGALIFVMLFISISSLDTHEYRFELEPPANMPGG